MSILSFPDRDPWGDKAYRGNCSGHNEHNAAKPGGIYRTLTGDIRRGGRCVSLQVEFIARMPRDERKAILIKTQHNTQSRNKSYGKMRFPSHPARVRAHGAPRIEPALASEGPAGSPAARGLH